MRKILKKGTFMNDQAYIPAEKTITEMTLRSFILGCLISMIVAASNAYLGLFAGMTVSASIPAAVISMSLLGLFKNNTILENNIVQTGGSAGGSLAAGVIFTIPALVLMGYWKEFNYFETTLIAITGGILGVLFTIPLRRALIVKKKLKYPEGIATAEVLKAGQEKGDSMKYLGLASLFGALFKFGASGAKLWSGVFEGGRLFGGKVFGYFGMNLSPALMGVGYIVGLRVSCILFIGGVLSWYVFIPAIIASTGVPEGKDAVDYAWFIWNSKIRYLGVGAMLTGGAWALVELRSAIFSAFQEGWDAFQSSRQNKKDVPRTDRDTNMKIVLGGIGALLFPIFYIYYTQIQDVPITLVMVLIMVVAGFLFASVAGYMAGLVGSSNNPTSGITIATILFASVVLLFLLGKDNPVGAAAAIFIGGVVCCACAIAGDNTQDLKSGYILGATPVKQQVAQIGGVVAAALVLGPVLNLLNTAYGFGPKTDLNPESLAAPQATLMRSVVEGVFGGGLPWDMIAWGALIGVVVIVTEKVLHKCNINFKIPVLAMAIGIYLPLELDSTIMFGGILAWLVSRFQQKKKNQVENVAEATKRSDQGGLLIASGLVTGEALVGILIALPVALSGDKNILRFFGDSWGVWPGVILLALLSFWLVRTGQKLFLKKL